MGGDQQRLCQFLEVWTIRRKSLREHAAPDENENAKLDCGLFGAQSLR